MAQILSRGESVYNCDICKRVVRLPINPVGLDVLQRCIITKGCLGNLHRVTNSKIIADTPSTTDSVVGVADWFQRKVLFTHEQILSSRTWIVEHNLGSVPITQVFVTRVNPITLLDELIETSNYSISSSSTVNTIKFDTAQHGVCQCLTLSSSVVEPSRLVTAKYVQLTHNSELTIATINPTTSINITVRFTNAGDGVVNDVTYNSVGNIPSILSPWSGTSKILLNGRKYYVRSFNLVETLAGPSFFNNLLINKSGLDVTFPGLVDNYSEAVILLSSAPYNAVDKIKTSYVDLYLCTTIPSSIVLVDGELITTDTAPRTTYPPIIQL